MRYLIIFIFFTIHFNLKAQSYQELDSLKSYIAAYNDSIPGLSNRVDISVSNTPLKEFLRAIAETHELNLSLDRIPSVTITNNFEAVSVGELLAFVCSTYDLDILFLNNIIIIHSKAKRKKPISMAYDAVQDRLSFNLDGDTLKYFSKELTNNTPYNIILSKSARNTVVYGFIEDLPFAEAMGQFAVSNDLQIEFGENNIYYLFINEPLAVEESSSVNSKKQTSAGYQRRGGSRRTSRNTTTTSNVPELVFENSQGFKDHIDVDATGADLYEAIKAISKANDKNYFFLEAPKGNLECHLNKVTFDDFLSVALHSASPSFSFSINNGTYVIGNPENLNIYESEVFTFQNRSVEKVSESIPNSLLKELEVHEYSDLNSLIITGSEQRIAKLASFLTQIDKPVANVLIEVMVVVINKGASIETGISAGLSDSIPSTSGTFLPGADMTLNSTAINKFLDDIDRKGLINLGRVTPQFYATIKALEQDNVLDLQSTPKLSTVNGHEASLVIGNSVYYLVETQNVTGGVNPIITKTPRYEKVEANLELNIKPYVSYNEDVTLTIAFESSDFIDPTVIGAPPGNSTRKFESKIRIKNEEMIVVGGLEQESTSESTRGLPGIAKVPVIKWFFSQNSKSTSTNKLLVFIKPTIVY